MKCFRNCALLALTCLFAVDAEEVNVERELKAMAQQVEILKTLHMTDVTRLTREVEELKQNSAQHSTSSLDRNEQATLRWAKAAVRQLRLEMRELSESVNNSALLQQMHILQDQLKQALAQTAELARTARAQETRLDQLDGEAASARQDARHTRALVAELRAHVGKLSKEVKAKEMQELNPDSFNDVLASQEEKFVEPQSHHKFRHSKMIVAQISRISRSQEQLDEYQQGLQSQLLNVQRRLDRFEEPNWYLLSTKIDSLENETSSLREELQNVSQKVSDLDKVHASMLELREDVENIENKVDKTIPEFRKEISKLDMNFAQLNAQSSYLKEDQENLRQSVKAIAVSVSNAVDRAELDRLQLQRLSGSVAELAGRSRQHFSRLNDHILKSESYNHYTTENDTIPLPQLIGEIKQLQPVEREYEDLVSQLPKDCSSISGPPGTYLIHPGHLPIDTWCSNGSTLLQRRYNGTIDFNRKFVEYVRGFGDAKSEYWIGLETMHQLSADNCTSMRIDMTDIYGGSWYAQYEHFAVSSADSGYVLDVGGFEGNASDAFEFQNHMEFSAVDRDRDISNTHCAGNYEGGWWYSHCQHVNINGKYTLGLTWFDSARNEWIAVASSEMRMYRRTGCT